MPTRAEMLTLLHEAAELEHQLMVQYLFAAYSLKSEPEEFQGSPDPQKSAARNRKWRDQVLAIAREEMGHLITVQQVILSLGGLPHFDRDSFPISAHYYPFPFTLEPLTTQSLAKYLWTEKPMEQGVVTRTALLGPDRADIETEVFGHLPNLLGTLYKAILAGLEELPKEDFDPDVETQTDLDRWPGLGAMAIVERIPNQRAAVNAIHRIVEQGEGHLFARDSHFHRFLSLYREFRQAVANGENPTRDVVTDPNTAEPDPVGADAHRQQALEEGRITAENTLRWARLFNKRYAVLLAELTHALMLPSVARRGRRSPLKTPRAKPRDDRSVRAMSPEDIASLTEKQVGTLHRGQIESLSADQIKGLGARQIRAMSLNQVRALRPSQIEALTTDALESLIREQLKPVIDARDPKKTALRGELQALLEAAELALRTQEQLRYLIRWARDEMTLVIAPIARYLTQLPVRGPDSKRAGAPFELESTGPTLPGDEKAQWCAHQRLIDETRLLLHIFPESTDPLNLRSAIRAIDRDRAEYIAAQLTRVTRESRERTDKIAEDIDTWLREKGDARAPR
jgi:hypothetical protein